MNNCNSKSINNKSINNVDTYNNYKNDIESDDTYNSMTKESCWYCRKVMTDVEGIYVEIETDRYICLDCGKEHNVHMVKCLDIDLCDLICGD